MIKQIQMFALIMIFPLLAFGQNQVTVDQNITSDTEWTNDNEYILDGAIFVTDGAKLFIEAGTVIKGEDGTDADASALVITQGSQIFADGTPTNPIIFTSILDEDADGDGILDGTKDQTGLWGGVIILGEAPTNNPTVQQVEGLNEIVPSGSNLADYGGNDPNDNSGVFRYVSIRHTGINIGTSSGNEIQGLTLGGVGAGTNIEFVESFASADDGFEWFGGTVNTRYLVSAFIEDDAFDTDEGFVGKNQFWFAILDSDQTGHMAEQDGSSTDSEDTTPFGYPKIANATYIGAGQVTQGTPPSGDPDEAILLRDNTGVEYYNSVFTDDFRSPFLVVEDTEGSVDSRARLEADSLNFQNSLFWALENGTASDMNIGNEDFTNTMLTSNNNSYSDPQLSGISRATDGGLDPRPGSGDALSGAVNLNDPFFQNVPFKGAFGGDLWIKGWTALDRKGFVADEGQDGQVVIDENITQDTFWSADNEYVLDGAIFVTDGASLSIEAGTVIKAQDGTDADASALVITQGSQIFAEGAPNNPIIFTSILDQDSDGDGILDGTKDQTGLWGGVIILGEAPTNNPTVQQVEGLNEIVPSGSDLADYGGNDPNDNSGVFRYVSIRHTGINIGTSSGNEIQGLTLGGVGAGTTIEFVESFASADDGFEWFGGTVNTRYLVSAFIEDDAFDTDEGFVGKGQFWFAILDNDQTGHMAEQDGSSTDSEDTTPFGYPQIANATYIGAGQVGSGDTPPSGDPDEAILLRDNTGVEYYNSVFTDDFRSPFLVVEDTEGSVDSRSRLEADSLNFTNSLFWALENGTATDLNIGNDDFTNTMLTSNNNSYSDPQLRGISRDTDGGLDPRPQDGSSALTGATAINDPVFSDVSFQGAFGGDLWIKGWTALDEKGFTPASTITFTDLDDELDNERPQSIELSQNYPNPFNPSTQITFSLPATQEVTLKVYDIMGREVATLLQNSRQSAGTNSVTFDATNVASGVYFYRLSTQNTSLTRKMTLIK